MIRRVLNRVRHGRRQQHIYLPPSGIKTLEKKPCQPPTNTAEFLEELNGGAFASQIGHALSEVAAGVVDYDKAGKVVITLDFSRIGESSQVKIKHKLDYKVPTKRGTRSENTSLDTPMHVGTGGNITLFQEKHDQLFSRDEAPINPRT